MRYVPILITSAATLMNVVEFYMNQPQYRASYVVFGLIAFSATLYLGARLLRR